MVVLPHSGLRTPDQLVPQVKGLRVLWLAHATPWQAKVYLGAAVVAGAENTGVEGSTPYLVDVVPDQEARIREHIAGCRDWQGEPVSDEGWLDALVEEREAEALVEERRPGQRLERVRTLTGHTTYQLTGLSSGEPVWPRGRREVWSGAEWSPSDDK